MREASAQGLSNLAARILDQLSITSWLPSAVLVLALVALGNLAAHEGNVSEAMQAFLSIGFGQVAAVFGMIAVATVLTQAFEFESIRLLEGYWGAQGLRRALADRSRSHYRRKFAALHRETDSVRAEAAKTAVSEIERHEIPGFAEGCEALLRYANVVDQECLAWRRRRFESGGRAQRLIDERAFLLRNLENADRQVADDEWWEPYAQPDLMARYNLLMKQLELMPGHAHRILPTRLGNVLRSFEERVSPPGTPDVERFVQRQIDELPPHLRTEHGQFRSRLDLYCSLVLVATLIAFIGLLLAPIHLAAASSWFVCWIAMATLSYRAAIASAQGYGSVLLSIKERNDRLVSP